MPIFGVQRYYCKDCAATGKQTHCGPFGSIANIDGQCRVCGGDNVVKYQEPWELAKELPLEDAIEMYAEVVSHPIFGVGYEWTRDACHARIVELLDLDPKEWKPLADVGVTSGLIDKNEALRRIREAVALAQMEK